MAVINYNIFNEDPTTGEQMPRGLVKVTWSALAAGDTGAPFRLAGYQLLSIQSEGTIGTSTVSIEGRNDRTNFRALKDPGGTSLGALATVGRIDAVQQPVEEIRPSVAAGTGTGLTFTMWAKAVQ